MTTEEKSQQQKDVLEFTANDVNEVTQDTWNQFLCQLKSDIRSSKKFGGSQYEKQFTDQCTIAQTEFYNLQLQFIDQTKNLIDKASKYSENETEKRKDAGETWQRIYDATVKRVKLILYPIQNVLRILHENDGESLKENPICFILSRLPTIINLVAFSTLFVKIFELPLIYAFPSVIFLGMTAPFAMNAWKKLMAQIKLSNGLSEASNMLDSEATVTTNAYLKAISMSALENNLNRLLRNMKLDDNIWFSNNRLLILQRELKEKEIRLNRQVPAVAEFHEF